MSVLLSDSWKESAAIMGHELGFQLVNSFIVVEMEVEGIITII